MHDVFDSNDDVPRFRRANLSPADSNDRSIRSDRMIGLWFQN